MKYEIQESLRIGLLFPPIPSDPDLEKMANLRLCRIIELAPPYSKGSARLEKSERGYFSSVEIYSQLRYLSAHADGVTARTAVRRALDKLECLLLRRRGKTRKSS